MPRRRAKIHEETILNWHTENYDEDSREYRLICCLAEEEEFNDPFATSFISDDSGLFCSAIGPSK